MGAEIRSSAPLLDLIIDLISSCDQDEGGQLSCSFLHDAASEKRTEDRLTLFHLMMKLKSPVLLGRRAVEHDLQWCLMAAATNQMV
jgi:hypothetical protein